MVAVALCFSFLRGLDWRAALIPVLGIGVAVALAWLPALAVLGARGPFAVRRLEWRADGLWQLVRPDGGCETGRLTRATAALGPWLLLAWVVEARAGRPPRRRLRRRYALIGVSAIGPAAFRALRGRLALLEHRSCRPPESLPGPVAA